jgi:hypothetical protein
MDQAPATAPRGPAPLLRRLAIAVCGIGIAAAGVLGVGWLAWAIGGVLFLAIGLSKFPFHRPSRWRLALATGPWWAPVGLLLMMTLASFSASGLFHSLGLLIRAGRRAAA